MPGITVPGGLNVPHALGDVTINPGDILCGDADGVVVVQPGEAHAEGEQVKMAKIMVEGRFDRPWEAEKLKELGYEL